MTNFKAVFCANCPFDKVAQISLTAGIKWVKIQNISKKETVNMKTYQKILAGLGSTALAVAVASPFIVGEVMWHGVLTKKGSDKLSKIFGEEPVEPSVKPAFDISEGVGDWFDSTPHEDVTTVNAVGDKPVAVLFRNGDSHKWAIICHGYTAEPCVMARYAREYYKKGYNLVMPYMRGCEKGVKSPKGVVAYTMGYLDKIDLVAWVNYVVELDPEAQIVLHGESMGAATVMMTVGENLPDNVKCAVEDCGYTSVWDEFSHQIVRMFHLPVFPYLYASQFCIKRHIDLDFKGASSVEALKKSKTPMLFIHGEADEFVPFEMVHKNYEAFSGEKDILTIPEADHALSVDTDPVTYFNKVWEFVGKYISE